jgi:lysophospholipase L1-like esterase
MRGRAGVGRSLHRSAWFSFSAVAAVALAGCEASAPAAPRRAERTAATAEESLGVRAATRADVPSPDPAAPAASEAASPAWVLHVGDSFTEAFFEQNLAPRFRAAGAPYVVEGVRSTSTYSWANDPTLDAQLAKRPSLVLVTLGANEFDIPSPTFRASSIEKIAHKIAAAGASCVWITPPMWTHETGILEVIYAHCSPCAYFDSDAVLGGGLAREEREPDRIHPNPRGGARWADAFWGWLVDHRGAARGWTVEPFERRTEYE